jgi:GT2 family glycosyltransferase
MGLGGVGAHIFLGHQASAHGFADVIREYSAVTGACMMVKKIFEEVDGFNAQRLPIGYNDIDLCLRLREKGYLVIYTPFTEIIHYESMSRGNDNDEQILCS